MPSFPAMLRTPLLHQTPASRKGSARLLDRRMLERSISRADDELRNFRRFLRYLCADLTFCPLPISAAIPSWIAFSVVSVVVPITSCFLLGHLRPYDFAVQVSSSISFFFLVYTSQWLYCSVAVNDC